MTRVSGCDTSSCILRHAWACNNQVCSALLGWERLVHFTQAICRPSQQPCRRVLFMHAQDLMHETVCTGCMRLARAAGRGANVDVNGL